MSNFYADWFSGKLSQGGGKPKPMTEAERIAEETEFSRGLACSEWGQKLYDRYDVEEVTQAEAKFSEAIRKISDKELMFEIDSIVGELASAYQILGFCAGRFSQDSRAMRL